MSSIIHPIKNEVADHASRPFFHCGVAGVRLLAATCSFDPFMTLRSSMEETEHLGTFASMAAATGRLNMRTMFAFSRAEKPTWR